MTPTSCNSECPFVLRLCLSLLRTDRLVWQCLYVMQRMNLSFQFILRFVQYVVSQHVYLSSHSSHFPPSFFSHPLQICSHTVPHSFQLSHDASHHIPSLISYLFLSCSPWPATKYYSIFIPCFHNYSPGLYTAMPSVAVT